MMMVETGIHYYTPESREVSKQWSILKGLTNGIICKA